MDLTTETFHQEEEQWYHQFLNIHYLASWKKNYKTGKEENIPSLEFTLSRKCNLKCTYCYYTRHGKELYPDPIDRVDPSIANCEKILEYLTREKLAPSRIEIFGGEAVSRDQYKKLFDILYSYVLALPTRLKKRTSTSFSIVFPLNVIFLEDREYYDLLIQEQKKFLEQNVVISYSISFDGKYCDPISRPAHSSTFEYSDAFYSLVSRFCKDLAIPAGFHPMISRDNVKYWKNNIDWFFDYIKDTYSVTSKDVNRFLYLLEVRNEDWSLENVKDFYDFIVYIIDKIFEDPDICNKDPDKLLEQIKTRLFNLSSGIFAYIPRGLTCSLQTCLYVRTGDLSIIPCHRLSYPSFIAGKFEVQEEKLTGRVITEFPYMHLASVNTNFQTHADCSSCEIRSLCPGPCLGANYEATKDPFIASPAMCRMEKAKVFAILESCKKYGILDTLISHLKEYSTGTFNEYRRFMLSKSMQVTLLTQSLE